MEEQKPGYYAIIPANVRYDDQIPANAKLLYGEISALIGADGFCFAQNQYFADIYGFSTETVARLVSKLEKAGYIKRELERDKSGQVVRRKLYLSVSMPEIHSLDNFDTTSPQKNQEGIDEKVKDTNTSITVSIKDDDKRRQRHAPLTDKQIETLCIDWIKCYPGADWPKDVKNGLYCALIGFYAPRDSKKQDPARTQAAFTALTNRLARHSEGNPLTMIDMLERATSAGWKSVFPPNAGGNQPSVPQVRRNEEWL